MHEQWEPATLPTLKIGSARYYGKQLRCHVLPALGTTRLCDITRVKIQTFLAEKRNSGLSGSSVHGMRTALSKVLQAAVDWNFIELNPARGIRIGDRGPKTERLYLNSSEVLRLLPALPEPCHMIVLIAVLPGMRIGENSRAAVEVPRPVARGHTDSRNRVRGTVRFSEDAEQSKRPTDE